jgi:hypothetical protein
MSLSTFTPNTIYGWAGLALMGGSFLYHKSLSTMGMVIGLAIGYYLYAVVDDNAAATTTSSS